MEYDELGKNVTSESSFEPRLGPWMLWGLGVGYVISGMYFGWNLGLAEGGTLGMAVATGFVILMYIAFTFSYTELACAIPRAGGAFDYARRAFGKEWGFFAGMAQCVEFIFAPPAIAFAIGAYLHAFIPSVPVLGIAIAAYLLFTALNIYGVQAAALFELGVTVLAVIGLVLFFFAAGPEFQWSHLAKNALPNGWQGAFAALPFAIWFFLGIEGVANVAEETIHPQKNILVGFGSAIFTLTGLCVLTFVLAVGINGWEAAVYDPATGGASDSPLPLVLQATSGSNSGLSKAVSVIGLFGLVASFHGIILASGRATFELGRVRFAPSTLGKIHPGFKTPANALLLNSAIGIVALLTGKTAEIITIACFGALSLYIISMLSVLRLRRVLPEMERPFRVPFYPLLPVVALAIAVIALAAICWYNPVQALIYLVLLLFAYIWFKLTYK